MGPDAQIVNTAFHTTSGTFVKKNSKTFRSTTSALLPLLYVSHIPIFVKGLWCKNSIRHLIIKIKHHYVLISYSYRTHIVLIHPEVLLRNFSFNSQRKLPGRHNWTSSLTTELFHAVNGSFSMSMTKC